VVKWWCVERDVEQALRRIEGLVGEVESRVSEG